MSAVRSPLPLPASVDVRVVFAALLVAAHLGDGLEPGMEGLAGDRVVRLVGVAAGWASSFATILALLALGFCVVRSVLVARASFGRSLLTGATGAGVAFATTAMVVGHAGPPSRVLLAALVFALLGTRAVAGATFVRLLPAVVVAAIAIAQALAARSFEQGGVLPWLGARAVSTAAWVGLVVLGVLVMRRLDREKRFLSFALLAGVAGCAALVDANAFGLGEAGSAFLRRALGHGALTVPPFGGGALPLWAPLILRAHAWAALAVLPLDAVALPLLAAFVPSLPSPLASLAVLLACHIDAAGADDGAPRES